MFEKEWNRLAKEVYKNAVNHGFWKDDTSREFMHGKSFWGETMDDSQYNDDAEYLLNMIQLFHSVLLENKNKPVRKLIEAYEQYFKFQLRL